MWKERFLRVCDRRWALERLFRCFPDDPDRVIEEIKDGEADPYEVVSHVIETLREDDLAPKTISFYLYLLKRFFLFCDIELSDKRLKAKLNLKRVKNVRRDRALTIDEVRRLVSMAHSPQLRLLVWLMATTGLRISEALSLSWEDLILDDFPRFKVISAKTGDIREVPVTRELLQELLKMKGSGKIFSYSRFSASNTFSKLLERLGMRKKVGKGYDVHLHSLRKFYKTRLEEAGVNPLMIELWMGHVSGVVHAYFKPSKKMEIEEWRKAEKALTLFSEYGDQVIEKKRIEELEREIEAIKRILTDVLTRLEASHNKQSFSKHP